MVGSKSLLFRYLREKLVAGAKQVTLRWLFCPNLIEGAVVDQKFCPADKNKAKENTEVLGKIDIVKIRPIQGKDIDDELAVLDGFENKDECIRAQMKINNFKDYYWFMERWGFAIYFKPHKDKGQTTLDGLLTGKKQKPTKQQRKLNNDNSGESA